MWYFVIGMVVGAILAGIGVLRLCIGRLKYQQDEDGTYFYMVLDSPDTGKILRKKYVLLKVDLSQK